ncbi:MAG: 5-guanidino-2-oxopentanoate decarboxylase [Pseudomonadota bacterium]
MDKPLGAQISRLLADRGVEVIFGIPGVHNVELYRGIEETGITHVLARHEQGAGFMADGYARATGRPGVAYVITGPGLTNIMTPMGQAYSDSVPLLVISSCLDETAARRGQLHQMRDQEGAARTVCDWSETARTAKAAYALVNTALHDFSAARSRPKHISVPIALLGAPAAAPDPCDVTASEGRPAIRDSEFSAIKALLRKARRPLLILGGGAVEAANKVREFLARCPIAVFTTYAGRGIVPSDYPFLFGSTLARNDSARVIGSADLVVAVGTELAEVDLWRDRLGHTGELVHVDIDSATLRNASGVSKRVRSTAQEFFDRLASSSDLPDTFDWGVDQVVQVRQQWRADVDAERPGIVPVCDALAEIMPNDAMIYSDMTQFAYVAKEVWDMDRPGHWHHPYGFGTLGYALPAAIGGAVARRGLPTLCIIGDYGLHYTMAEMGVAVELELPLPILVWDNGKLKEIEDCMVSSQIAPNAVVARNPDFCKLAEAFGALATAPTTLVDLQRAVLAAFDAKGPTLIHVTPEIVGDA